jgi:NAD(P)-dependent dehydrogenase (short-subunit alcohol dehydrogenase family)
LNCSVCHGKGWHHNGGCFRLRFVNGTDDVGIGLALATDLSAKGWKLVIVDMNVEQGNAAVAKFGRENATFIKADVSKWEDNVNFFKLAKETYGRIDFGKFPD